MRDPDKLDRVIDKALRDGRRDIEVGRETDKKVIKLLDSLETRAL